MISEYRISRTVTPAASMALVTVDQAKAALGIDPADTTQDASLTAQIASVSQGIFRYVDRVLVQQSYRDQFRYVCNYNYPGEPLQLRQYPIAVDITGAPLATITEDGVAVDPLYYEADTDRGLLYRLDGADPYGWTGMLITVDYTAGYEPIPDDIQAAALDWLTSRYHAEGRDPALRSETIPDVLSQVYAGDFGAGTSGGAIPPAARDLLQPYRLYSL
jgi:hypothetical protein